jgi:cellobiose phosphorylase
VYEKPALKTDRKGDNILLSAGDSMTQSAGTASFIPPVSLEFFNGIGGFAADGQEYEMWLGTGRKTPAPWINVIANESFGFHVSETGAGYTWAGNSRENKLTDWSNDPVLDTASEAVYIKDQKSGAITSPASLRSGRGLVYQVRHGFGYSVFAHMELELEQSMTLFAAQKDPVKLWLIKIRDHSGSDRDLSVTLYVEWVLGALKEQCAPYIVTQYSAPMQLLTARNVYTEFEQQHPAFLFSSEPISSFTGDKKGFLGVGRSISYPLGLATEKLSGDTGACLEPCGAIQMNIHLDAGESKTLVLGLGQADSIIQAVDLANKFRNVQAAQNELALVRDYWNTTLSRVHVKTPDRAADILLNGWLVYQIISCRLHARSAFYQCGGAYGFRDQLQDVLSLLDVDADLAKNQIRLCSAHQFMEGDVQHWWQPVTGVGVRTRISDDMLWLPYVTASYVAQTGNSDILLETIPYLEGDTLEPSESEKMFVARVSGKTEDIYRHCLQAFDCASRFGVNGLPLMGTGDWNDGMNRVGIGGKGESVWLGWFFYAAVKKFLPLCLLMHDQERYDQMNGLAEQVRSQIEQNAWDGQWYLRGFFDNGSTLGSHDNEECQIDSISQSWAVISGGGDPVRTGQALDSAKHFLVHQADGVIQLLTPPFNKSLPDPGYIKGYFPGIRENGGQYTHAALWLAIANAKAGRGRDSNEFVNMLNPILATSTIKDVARYEKEPYVMSADVYMGGQFTGKAGWSWYTGSAGWMYQCLLHSQLGITRAGDKITIAPAVPALYREWEIDYQYGSALYRIKVENDSGQGISIHSITVDGTPETGGSILLHDDGHNHSVLVIMSA